MATTGIDGWIDGGVDGYIEGGGGIVLPPIDVVPKRSRLASSVSAVYVTPPPVVVMISSTTAATLIEVSHG